MNPLFKLLNAVVAVNIEFYEAINRQLQSAHVQEQVRELAEEIAEGIRKSGIEKTTERLYLAGKEVEDSAKEVGHIFSKAFRKARKNGLAAVEAQPDSVN